MLQPEIDAYLAYHAAADWSPKSVHHYRYVFRRVVRWLEERGHRRWATVSASDLDAFLLDLLERGLSRSTRDHFAWALHIFGVWLTTRGKVLRNPAEDLNVPEDNEVALPPAPLTEEQVTSIFEAIPRRTVIDLRNRLHLEVLYSCGLRNAEAVHLDVSDLDLNERTVLVREGKMGKSRLLPMLTSTLVAATEYLALRRDLLRGPDQGALFMNQRGKRLPEWWMQRWLQGVSRTLGFRVHPHLLRHSIAVHLLRRGADVRHIQEFLGHADLETTKIYLRLVPGHLREDYDKAMPILMQAPA